MLFMIYLKGVLELYTKDKSKQLVVRLSSEQYERVCYFAERFNGSKSDFIRMLIDWFSSMGGVDNEEK